MGGLSPPVLVPNPPATLSGAPYVFDDDPFPAVRLVIPPRAITRARRPSAVVAAREAAFRAGQGPNARGQWKIERVLEAKRKPGSRSILALIKWEGRHADSWEPIGMLSEDMRAEARSLILPGPLSARMPRAAYVPPVGVRRNPDRAARGAVGATGAGGSEVVRAEGGEEGMEVEEGSETSGESEMEEEGELPAGWFEVSEVLRWRGRGAGATALLRYAGVDDGGQVLEPVWVGWRDLMPSVRALAPRVPRASRRGAVARSSNAVVAAQAAARARLERAERIAAARLRDGRAAGRSARS